VKFVKSLKIQAGSYTLHLDQKTHVMGILNATPDSFSDGGRYNHVDQAIDRAAQMVREGADILDIGGESTRPGAEKVALEEEIERVMPVISAISSRFDIPISIDTYKAEVATQALEAGAHIINDVWGAKAAANMAAVAAETKAPIILMHNRNNKEYSNLMQDFLQDIQASIDIVRQAGVKEDKIILDPGIGFAKTYEHNLEVMRHLEQLVAQGYPVLLGTSRKQMIGKTLDLPVEERVEGTIATVCLGIAKGCQIVRVHDVAQVSRAVKMMDAMLGKEGVVEHG
jgi:dihydropteroate synthase